MASASASTARSSRCYAVLCRNSPTTGSHFFLRSYKRPAPRRQSRLASRRLVSCLDARCDFRSTSVPHCLNLLATSARSRTSFSKISSGRIRSPAKWSERSTSAQIRVTTITSLRNFSSLASLCASFKTDGITAHYRNWCRTTPVCVKCWQSKAQSLRFESSTHAASSRRTTTPFGSYRSLRIAFLLPRLVHRTQMIVRCHLHQTLVTERSHLRRLWRRFNCRLPPQQLKTTPYSRLHLRLLLSSKPQETRYSMPVLVLNVVEIIRRISMIRSFHLFNERTMSRVQNFLSRHLLFLMIRKLCAQVQLIYYSTYTLLRIQITTLLSYRARTQTTILQLVSFALLMIQHFLRYHHTRIALL